MFVPYIPQATGWTCGPACMRMVLEAFGIKKSETELVRILHTNNSFGTYEKELPKLAEKFKLSYMVEHNGTLEDLKKFMREDFICIVSMHIPQTQEDHFTIPIKIGRKYVYFYDPYFGKNHRLKFSYFMRLWESLSEKDKRYFIAFKKLLN